ncbi:choice-of-anchor D domain-containing protein [Flavobacterium sp.]|uniref:choice-of-anchor D domain-containing protein n=1 Tax=Flavobacterium sp. TaxID=239 RepID=UPI00260607A4|nr:choice-of-anchor D domain-containing protein [Flavobacterium sp.]
MKKTTRLLLIAILLLGTALSSKLFAQSRTYTSTGVFTPPAGVNSVRVELWGAGGAGGGVTGTGSAGGGGAGGAYTRHNAIPVVAGTNYTVNVGVGGTGSTGIGAPGGSTWFSSTTTLLAVGGNGGARANNNNQSAAGATGPLTGNVGGQVNFYGGAGSAGVALTSGGAGGSSAGTGSNGNNALAAVGGTAPTGGGAGANGVIGDSNGITALAIGGGGGGARAATSTDRLGGPGGPGQAIVTWTCPTYSLNSTTLSSSTICSGQTVTVTLSGTGLPQGTYTVTYNLSGSVISNGVTAAMTVSASNVGTFTTPSLNNAGTVTVTITNLSSGSSPVLCSNAISANNTASVTVNTVPSQPGSITGNSTFCPGQIVSYSVTAVPGVTYTWTFPTNWTQQTGGTSSSVTVLTTTNTGDVTVTPSNSCGNGTPRSLTVISDYPTITSTTGASRNDFGPLTLQATASAGTISWYDVAVGGSALGTGTSFTTPDLVSTTLFYVEANVNGCVTVPRVAVAAEIIAPEIVFSGNGFNIVDEDNTPETTDFTNVGTTNVGIQLNRTFIIENSGTANLTLGAITITGANSSEFVVATAPAATVVPGGSTSVVIRFTPTAVGTRTANFSIVTNDADENPFSFDLAGTGGTGVTPEIDIVGNGVSILDGASGTTTTNHTNFGTALIPGTITRTFTIFNTGTGPLNLTGTPIVVLTGGPEFTVSQQPNAVIPAGGSSTFQITYAPTVAGTTVAIISINNTDNDENIYDFVVQGAALVAGREIDIQGNEISIADGDTTPAVNDQTNFGQTDSATSIAIPFNIYSLGTNSLTLSTTVGISGPNAALFTATPVPASLASGAVASFVVTFTPNTVLGVKTATITVTSNDPNEGTYDFVVSADIVNAPVPTSAPGGITSNLRFWLKANSNVGSLNDNDDMQTWQDQVLGSTKTAISRFAREPKFRNNPSSNVNFNPVVNFNGANSMSGNQGFYNSEMFIVIRPTGTITSASNPQDIYCGDDIATNRNSQDVTGFQMGNTSVRHTNEVLAYNQGAQTSYGTGEISTTKSYRGVQIFNPRKSAAGRMEILCNGNLLTTTEVFPATYKDIVNSRYWLGRSEFFDASYNGDILEIINYSTRNNTTDRQRIESYLAIKYGITLGVNGISQNYLDSAGSVIYNSGAGFNYNVAGIGRDDLSGLNQKQSKTENTNADITIGLSTIAETNSANTATFAGDKRFLVWGSNNGTLGAQAPVIVNMSSGISGLTSQVDFVSIGRTWRVVETGGDVATVTVSVPSTLLTSTITPPGDFLMFISSSPIFSPTAEYRIMRFNGSKLECTYDFNGTRYITFGYAPERTFERCITFDGVNDYLDAGPVLNVNTDFTISAWVRKQQDGRSILSKRNASFTEGYDFTINSAGQLEFSFIAGGLQQITSSTVIPADIWHNVAVTGQNGVYTLYIDGVAAAAQTLPVVPANNQSFLIAGADAISPTSFFRGGIDEVRVFSTALSANELRYIMNQELRNNNNFVNGSILPASVTKNEVADIPYANLEAYYPMSTYTYTNAKDQSTNDYTAALKNLTTVDYQTAPLPYRSTANGNWYTPGVWNNSTVTDAPYSLSIVDGTTRIAWNIVQSSHNIESTGNKVVLGLDVTANKMSAANNSKIEVTHYLKLDGTIDLTSLSQLVQTTDSDYDAASIGGIEREQSGQSNSFNYNFWCSPVSTPNTPPNSGYTVSGVLRDATDPENLLNINWIDDYYGQPTSPITLGAYWLYKFQNVGNDYANWSFLGVDGNLLPGEGFTMKGPGSAGANQNYGFVGKPNNGEITLPIGGGFLNLCGNPYPSALDAHAFINDNLGSLDGTLYFWEHYSTNFTHNVGDYQGGYAALTLVGSTPPVNPPGGSGLGSSTRTAGRYIPVGQGFFVTGNTTGGSIVFNNNQRAFVRETNAQSNVMFRSAISNDSGNEEDEIPANTFKKFKFSCTAPQGERRQLLVGFMNQFATENYDPGYDALVFDETPSDMYMILNDSKYVIDGEGTFDVDKLIPLGVKAANTGNVIIKVDEIENFDTSENIYLFDALNNTWTDIKNGEATIYLEAGLYENRFSITFNNSPLTVENIQKNTCAVAYNSQANELSIEAGNERIEAVEIFDISGKLIETISDVNATTLLNFKLQKHSIGAYVVKITTENAVYSRKMILH